MGGGRKIYALVHATTEYAALYVHYDTKKFELLLCLSFCLGSGTNPSTQKDA